MIRILTGFPFSWWKRAAAVVPVAATGGPVVYSRKPISKPLWATAEFYTSFVPLIFPVEVAGKFELPALEIEATATQRHVASAEFSIGGIEINAHAGYRPPLVSSMAAFGLPPLHIKAHAVWDLTPFLKREDEELLELLAA